MRVALCQIPVSSSAVRQRRAGAAALRRPRTGGRPGGVPRGDPDQVRLGPARGRRAAGRAVLLRSGGGGQTDRGRAGGRGLRARPGRAGVQHRGRLRRSPGSWSPRTASCTCSTRSGSGSPTWSRRGPPRSSARWPGCAPGWRSATTCGSASSPGRWRWAGPRSSCCPRPGRRGCSRRTTGSRWCGRAPSRTPCGSPRSGRCPTRTSRSTRAATGVGRSMLVDPLGVVRADLGPDPGWRSPRSTRT
jgi:hypothetical protein